MSGSYTYGLDRKGRLVIPAQFTAKLGNPIMVCAAPGGSAIALPRPLWLTLLEVSGNRLWWDYWLSASWQVSRGRNGRICLPCELRQHMGVVCPDDLVQSGIGTAVLIERRDRWEARMGTPGLEATTAAILRARGVELPEQAGPRPRRLAGVAR